MVDLFCVLGWQRRRAPSVQTSVSSVAALCTGISKSVATDIGKSPQMLQTTETFLKAVLRHYVVDTKVANKQLLLHGRAKFYYRVGRLLQAWPQHKVRQTGCDVCASLTLV